MRNYSTVRRLFHAAIVLGVAGILTFAGCKTVDDTVGFDLVPGNQQMKMLRKSFTSGFRTRLYRTDSVKSSNLSYGYYGVSASDTFGIRKAGFLTQILFGSISDRTDWYGYRPIFDSIQLLFSISSYRGDTLQPQTFQVFEVTDNAYLSDNRGAGGTAADSIFYSDFDLARSGVDLHKPLFEFTFPDGKTTGPATTAVTMKPTADGLKYVRRLMMQEPLSDGKTVDSTYYLNDSLWVNTFKGLVIRPKDYRGRGALFATDLGSSGFMLYCRNRDSVDTGLIRDTVQSLFYFYDKYAKFGNVSINTVDYSDGPFFSYSAITEQQDRPVVSTGYVEGMDGVLVEIDLTDEFMEQFGRLQESTDYRSVAVNQALLYIYVDGLTEQDIDPEVEPGVEPTFPLSIIEQFDNAPERLGLYVNFKKLTAIADYVYIYENQDDTKLPYGGKLNRSRGCYVMNVSTYLQNLWKLYQERAASGGTPTAEELDQRKIYLGPSATDLFTFGQVALQGEGNRLPMRMEVTYTLVK